MDQETARFIINHFGHLMTTQEKLAWKHYLSTLKLADNDSQTMTKMYRKKGWLSKNPHVLSLLKNGYDNYEMNTVNRILFNNNDEVFLINVQNANSLPGHQKLNNVEIAVTIGMRSNFKIIGHQYE